MRPRLAYNFRRLAQISFQNVGRNLLLSVATTVMMGLILFIFNVIMVLNVLTQTSLDQLAEKIDLIVYLNEGASAYEINDLVQEIQSLPVVTEVEFTSSDDALKEFMDLYPDKSDPFTVYGIKNPLPSSIRVVTESPDQHKMVLDYLNGSAYSGFLSSTESSNENEAIAAKLVSVTQFTKKLIVGVVITFLFGSLLMIMNAIHLSIFTRKTEIQVMQLVGAKPGMIRFPFLFEGGVYSLVAVFFSFFLLMFFLEGTALSDYINFSANFNPIWLFLGELLTSIAVGVAASYLATDFYLNRTLVLDPT